MMCWIQNLYYASVNKQQNWLRISG